MVILVFFELAYGIRFIFYKFLYQNDGSIDDLIMSLIIAITEGSSLLALMLYHNKNFKSNQSVDVDDVTTQSVLFSDTSKQTVAHLTMLTSSIQDSLIKEDTDMDGESLPEFK